MLGPICFIICAIILLVFAILLIYYRMFHKSAVFFESSKYDVVQRYGDRAEAARVLGSINAKASMLIDHLSHQDNLAARNVVAFYRPETLKESDPIWSIGHKAYTNEEGQISICLRHRGGTFYDEETIWFVFLHELSHVATIHKIGEEDHHPPEFWSNFTYILHQAHQLRLYNPVDYAANPIKYCDITIDNNPFYN